MRGGAQAVLVPHARLGNLADALHVVGLAPRTCTVARVLLQCTSSLCVCSSERSFEGCGLQVVARGYVRCCSDGHLQLTSRAVSSPYPSQSHTYHIASALQRTPLARSQSKPPRSFGLVLRASSSVSLAVWFQYSTNFKMNCRKNYSAHCQYY
jgi:hypothetical protein